jgi:hypothetical protein
MVPGKISHCMGMLGSYRQHLKTLHFHNLVKIRR